MDVYKAIEIAESIGVHEHGPLSRNWNFSITKLEEFIQAIEKQTIEELKANGQAKQDN